MSSIRKPSLPIPEPIRGREEGTWASSTIKVRLPEIARRVQDENDYSRAALAKLDSLIADIPTGKMRFLEDPGAPDIRAWEGFLEPYLGATWLEVPWFFAEVCFYRRILEATGFFQPGNEMGHDPYKYQKNLGLTSSFDLIRVSSAWVNQEIGKGDWSPEVLAELIVSDLWGNSADLSLWPVEQPDSMSTAIPPRSSKGIIISEIKAVIDYLMRAGPDPLRIDFVVDNAGYELVADLSLADYLLSTRLANCVFFHLKSHPTFVSDATIEDVYLTTDYLVGTSDIEVRLQGLRFKEYLENGQFRLDAEPYWTSPLSAWEMPDALFRELSQSQLVVFKGDANYRRLLGDRHWPFTTNFRDILSYMNFPVLAIRTLKSELASGLSEGQAEQLQAADPDWLTNGQWGVIQFAPSAPKN